MANPVPPTASPVRAPDEVLGFLLKHAHLALERRTDAELGALDIDSRDLGVLRVIARGAARSQQEIAAVIGLDRTSMVATLDSLQRRGLIDRRPAETDRRRNVVVLTGHGGELFERAEARSRQVESDFTAAVSPTRAAGLHQALRALLDADDARG